MMAQALPQPFRLLILLGGLLLAGAILVVLRARDRRVERREARRLERLAEASSRLVRLRGRDVVEAALLAAIPGLLNCRSLHLDREASGLPCDKDPRRLHAALVNDAGVVLGSIEVELVQRARPGDAAALTQMVDSATAALETTSLLESAEASGHRTKVILSTMSDAMLALDNEHRLTFLNPQAALLLSAPIEALLGRKLFDLLPARADPRLKGELERLVVTKRDETARLFWPDAESEPSRLRGAWVMVRASRHEGGTTLFMQDITRQVETEEQLRQTAKMEAIGQLTGGIAHDFNNLLTVILGNLEMLEELTTRDAMASELVALAQRSARNAAGLTARLLAFARRQPLAPTDINIALLVGQLGALLRRTLGSGIMIRIEQSEQLWTARADAGQLENAIINLAINARDAMKGNGTLTLSLSNRAIGFEDLAGELAPGEYTQIRLTDTGHGIEPDLLARVFEPFFTTKPVGAGTGLGLSMVYGFAKQSGGCVTLESMVGRGTTATLMLPRGGPVTNNDLMLRSQVALPRGEGERILVVEDAALVRRFVVNVLENLGYAVTTAQDGESALTTLAGEFKPDLVVTDVMLPGGLDGQDVARAARRLNPAVPIVFISGFTDHDLLNDLLQDRKMSFIRKPFRRSDLAVHVRRQLAESTGAPALFQ